MSDLVRWGILGAARIARKAVVPGMLKSRSSAVVAVASRSRERAHEFASELGIARSYGSYEELLADPGVDAVYIPLPNHLHVPWSIRALEAGKHVLCEKPIALNAEEAAALLEASRRHPHLKVMEAFMYRLHPQWQRTLDLVNRGSLGRLRTIHSFFSYFKTDPTDIRNVADMGGGGLLDIGCYCVSLSRWLWGDEPLRVSGHIERDPALGIDRLTSALLEFEGGTATFTCATQLAPYQRVQVLGEQGRLEVIRPFNAEPDRAMYLRLERAGEIEEIEVPAADQYERQAELFARAVLEDRPVPTPLEDAVANMRAIDAVAASAATGRWREVPRD